MVLMIVKVSTFRMTLLIDRIDWLYFSSEDSKRNEILTLLPSIQAIDKLEAISNNLIKYPIRKTALELNIDYNLIQKWWTKLSRLARLEPTWNLCIQRPD